MTLQRKTPLGRKPRARGNRFELEIVNLLKAHGYRAYRTLASGGYGGSDVQGLPGFGIECKMVEKLNVWAALAQAETAASPTETPLLVFRRARSRTYACLPFEDLLGLIKEARR
jgi:hypothetical protein